MVGQGCCSDHRDNADWAGLACLFRQGKRQSRSRDVKLRGLSNINFILQMREAPTT